MTIKMNTKSITNKSKKKIIKEHTTNLNIVTLKVEIKLHT